MQTADFIAAHAPKVALQFSGGRDSLAMLLHLREHWPRLTVYYTDSGDSYPETRALVKRVRSMVPRLVTIDGKQPETMYRHGWPSDVTQAGAMWPYGQQQIADHVPLIDRYFCCLHSIMLPMHQRMLADGITLLLRGQRDSDEPKSHVRSGETHDGMTIVYPIADWTDAQVHACIEAGGFDVPPYYAQGMTSAPDCMRCTAWLEHGAVSYLGRNHPKVAAEVRQRLVKINATVEPFLARVRQAAEVLP